MLRDSEGATSIKEVGGKSLPNDWNSFNEINYLVFGVSGEDYLNELYGYLQSEKFEGKDVETELAKKEDQNKTRAHYKDKKKTTTTYIRDEMHHKTNECEYDQDNVATGIKNLQIIISELSEAAPQKAEQ